ncbi:MAG: YggS family pyridoxal phosphate-dependent enzyme [Clostridia bacterium]|nr:YggS family pyridoxal phosphate-dependent enzyme [Clostridia bacterium]
MQENRTVQPLMEELDPQVLRANVESVLAALEENRYQTQPPARLIAVTKTVAPGVINQLKELGILDIGENRAQVALPKLPRIAPEFRLHWIGRLQTNKVKDIIDNVCMLHSLDRLELAREVDRRARQHGRIIPALVQVNVAGEEQKGGMPVQEVEGFLREMRHYPNIHVEGLMAIMPLGASEEELDRLFGEMRSLFDAMRALNIEGVEMRELSMGMSNDFRIAARNGATMVRVGTALYRRD